MCTVLSAPCATSDHRWIGQTQEDPSRRHACQQCQVALSFTSVFPCLNWQPAEPVVHAIYGEGVFSLLGRSLHLYIHVYMRLAARGHAGTHHAWGSSVAFTPHGPQRFQFFWANWQLVEPNCDPIIGPLFHFLAPPPTPTPCGSGDRRGPLYPRHVVWDD